MKSQKVLNAVLAAVLTGSLTAPAFAQTIADESVTVAASQDEQSFMAQNDLYDVDLTGADLQVAAVKAQKNDDVVSGVVWLGKEIGHGAKVTAKFTYKHVLKPIGKDTWTVLKDATKGTVFVAVEVVKGTVTVTRVIVKGAEMAYADVLSPLIVAPLIQAGKLALVDGVYGLILCPTAEFLKDVAHGDVVKGVEDLGQGEVNGVTNLVTDAAKEAISDAKAYYKVVIYPIYNDVVRPTGEVAIDGTMDAGKAIGWLACEYANSFRDSAKTCKFIPADAGN